MRKYCYPLLVTLLALLGCSEKDLLPQAKKLTIDSLLMQANVTGLQLNYFEGDREATYEFGYKDLGDSNLVDANTIFQAASLSKQATALLALRLMDAGRLELEQHVASVYQEPRLSSEPRRTDITVAHLLSHSSGLPNWGGDELSLDFDPGTQWQYSGEGYVLLSKLMAKVMDQPFEDLAQEWVFEPLGMVNSSFVWRDSFSDNESIGHNMIQQRGQADRTTEVNAAASLLTTATDYAKLLRGISKNGFLTTKSRKLITEEFIDAKAWGANESNEYIAWSLGAGLQKNKQETALWQWGDNFLYRGMMIYFPASERGLVYLTNSENGLSMAETLFSYFFDEPSYAVRWIDYERFDEPERAGAIALEMAFVHGDSTAAFAAYERALSESPELLTDNLINNMVWSLFGEKRLDAATRLIDKHLANFPNSAEANVRKGEALAFAHDYSASWQAYQVAMELDPNTSRVIMPRFPWYQEIWGALQEEEETLLDLSSYEGQYGDIVISTEGDELLFSDGQRKQVPLVRFGNSVFDLDNLETFRLRFAIEGDDVVGVTKSHLTGREAYMPKLGV